MAPTTMENQVTKTSPYGRDVTDVGYPIRACELINTLESPVYIERTSVHDVKNIIKTKKALKKRSSIRRMERDILLLKYFQCVRQNWGVAPQTGADWVRDVMVPYYPLKKFRDIEEN